MQENDRFHVSACRQFYPDPKSMMHHYLRLIKVQFVKEKLYPRPNYVQKCFEGCVGFVPEIAERVMV